MKQLRHNLMIAKKAWMKNIFKWDEKNERKVKLFNVFLCYN